ncbi:MAG: tRNA lysidine(34) synthetase TilS [Bacteroidota bacterium]
MVIALAQFVQKNQLFSPKDKVLVAVSGGIDSMVLASLLYKLGQPMGIAHCNFQLRGEASEADEVLVRRWSEKRNIPFHCSKFDTKKESVLQKKSIELTAREQRYAWFQKLIKAFDYQVIATAHHLNDSLETLLFNLVKGTGIRGLHGIPVKNGQIVRPLSFATRQMVEEYAEESGIAFRTDASNNNTQFSRNLIRHEVIPVLRQLNPSLENTFSQTLRQLKDTEQLFLWAVQQHKNTMINEENNLIKIDITELKKAPAMRTVLFEIIKDFGFSSDHVDQIFRAIDNVGAQFYSQTHRILVERKHILVKKKGEVEPLHFEITSYPATLHLYRQRLNVQELDEQPSELNQGKAVAFFDADKLQLPLNVRNWQDGDRFQPIGMNGQSKKVKDYLRDEKVSRIRKEQILVVESQGEIVWLVGHRMDERFKLGDTTERIVQMRLE